MALYLYCGISDVLDGYVARKTNTVSDTGAKLDSIADLVFAVFYAVKIVPYLAISRVIIVWIVTIAIIKILGFILTYIKEKRCESFYSKINKVLGVLLFFYHL